VERPVTTSGSDFFHAFAGDIDGDGDIDFLSAAAGSNQVAWHQNDGSQNFTEQVISTNALGVSGVYIGDVDSDGDMDVLSASQSDNKVAWYENDGSENFSERVISTVAGNAADVKTADMDGDGDQDVISAAFDPLNLTNSKLAWYENDGSQIFTERVLTNVNPTGIYPIDVDSDGDMDLVVSSQDAAFSGPDEDKIVWFENDGNQNFTERIVDTNPSFIGATYAKDMDVDGDVDLLIASGLNFLAWYENDGSQNFTVNEIGVMVSQPRDVYATDIDGDGDMDVLVTSELLDQVAWYENDGSQNFTEQVITTNADLAWSVYAADVDSDGDMDVLAASRFDDKVAWHENTSPPNSIPVLTASVSSVTYTENAAPVIVDAGIMVSDSNDTDLQSATITITGNFVATEDVLDFNPQGGITGSFDTLTGALSLSGLAPLANYQAALQSVTYENTSDNFDPAMSRSAEFVVNDGQDSSNAESVSVQLIPVNDPPVVTTTVTSFTYIIGEGPVVIDPGVTVVDVDDANLESASIAISINFIPMEDILAFTDQNGITGSFDGVNGVMNLTGTSLISSYQDALRSVTYENTNQEPDTIQRTVGYQVSDGQDSSNIAAAMNEILVDFIPGELEIYNAISPNGDLKHDWLEIRNIEILFPNNRVEIFNRWGNVVYEISGYDNTDVTRRFSGMANVNNDNELPDGTYFYKIDLGDGSPILSGFVVLKK